MHKRTLAVLLGIITLLVLASLGCSVGQLAVRRVPPTITPTRTPRPTWTPVPGALMVASPTLDATRFPGVTLPTDPPPTPQMYVPGGEGQIFVPLPGPGGPAVQTVVVIIVTATPVPPPTPTPGPPTLTPLPTFTPGPPTPTPTPTATPLPPVTVKVKSDKANVRQGPGAGYPLIAQLARDTEITVVGRNVAGDWWKVCCVNGVDVWIAAQLVTASGPIYSVPEISDFPPPPPTQAPPPTPLPLPTYAMPMVLEGRVQEYPLGLDYFRVDAVVYNGSTPLWGYKLSIKNLSTGQTWLSAGSESSWNWNVLQYPTDKLAFNPNIDCQASGRGAVCLRTNVKWDSNGLSVPAGDATWEVTATDGGGQALSRPVRLSTSSAYPKWFYIVFRSNL